MPPTGLRARTTVDLDGLRVAAGLMLAVAVAIPALPPGHRGLPCPLRTLTGIPCPLCGMTTSVTAAVHLDPGAAIAANPAGLLAVVFAVGLLAFPRARRVALPSWMLATALVLMWVWELFRFDLV